MNATRRHAQEAAWLLHHRPYRDSSQLIDMLTREHGRIALVARGSRSARSKLRGILRPFLPLSISWVSKSDLGTRTGAESHGLPMRLDGEALLSAYYVNELLLKLTHRHDPQPEVFDLYGHTVARLAAGERLTVALRQFELNLLQALGYALNLDHDTQSNRSLAADAWYDYRPEQGPVPAAAGPDAYRGASLEAIRRGDFDSDDVLRDAGRLLRDVISFHLGGKSLNSRKVLLELRRAGSD